MYFTSNGRLEQPAPRRIKRCAAFETRCLVCSAKGGITGRPTAAKLNANKTRSCGTLPLRLTKSNNRLGQKEPLYQVLHSPPSTRAAPRGAKKTGHHNGSVAQRRLWSDTLLLGSGWTELAMPPSVDQSPTLKTPAAYDPPTQINAATTGAIWKDGVPCGGSLRPQRNQQTLLARSEVRRALSKFMASKAWAKKEPP